MGTRRPTTPSALHWARETQRRLTRYADEHTRDCGGDRSRALAEMSDELRYVADGVGCTVDEVQAWIEAVRAEVR
jgi:hypothetical protein